MMTDAPALRLADQRSPWRLEALEVFNWGPFAGLHRAEFDAGGTAIIGMTGSGKTTLVDALMTLLTEAPKYNLASTGGHESDRSLLSYVRGVLGSDNASGDGSHISRKGATTTGLCATYSDGPRVLRCAGLLWLEGVSMGYADLRRAWMFSLDREQGLEQWLSLLHDGGLRGLKQHLRDNERIQIFDTANGGKRAYLARLRTFFEVGDNAFDLLNRAAGLKQLNSIDDLFREFVLDDRSAFGRALEVAGDFTTLSEIHAELLTARSQLQSLLPVARLDADHRSCATELAEHEEIRRLLRTWYALQARRLWAERAETLGAELSLAASDLAKSNEAVGAAHAKERELQARYLQAGGGDIDSLKELQRLHERTVAARRQAFRACEQLSARFALPVPRGAAELSAAQEQARTVVEGMHAKMAGDEELRFGLGADLQRMRQEIAALEAEKREVEACPESNLPRGYAAFRAAMAQALGVSTAELPFVAELVQVREDEASWRGAIERALGGHRLRLLVAPALAQRAWQWVNSRHNGLHVRLWEATPATQPAADAFADGFVCKLNIKEHALTSALRGFLASHDLHCVESAEQLRLTPHALTREGTVSARRGYAEKADQHALHEGWCTGFDNRDRLEELAGKLAALQSQAKALEARLNAAGKALAALRQEADLLEAYAQGSFESIDLEGATRELEAVQGRLAALIAPDSDATQALRLLELAKVETERLEASRKTAEKRHNRAELLLEEAEGNVRKAEARCGAGLSAEQEQLARARLRIPASLSADQVDEAERRAAAANETALGDLQQRQLRLQADLVRAMSAAKQVDTGALVDVGTELADLPAYLARLRQLDKEALPAKLDRFLTYLNKASDEGVTQLLSLVREEVTRIEERIADLNRSLQCVDFKEGRFLQLVTQPVVHESVRTLEKAQRALRAAMLRTDDQGEAHYLALKELVALLRDAAEKKHTVGARALLDARFRLEFHGVEICRETSRELSRFKGSQGGSGGEKEIIASYILTASLSYALSAQGGSRPLHATVVLDEAFSKSSRAVAQRIARALEEFGLHPIFVTPNKEVRLLRAHTRSVVHVHRRDTRSMLASIRWEELDARVQEKNSEGRTQDSGLRTQEAELGSLEAAEVAPDGQMEAPVEKDVSGVAGEEGAEG